MATVFNWAKLVQQLNNAFNATNGHNHDGTNSKAVTVGTVADNAITTAKILAGALSADAAGRGKFANDFFDAATVLAKFATDSIDNAQLLKAVKNGAFVADAATRALFADGLFPPEKLTSIANTSTLMYQVADLAAGADITTRAIFEAPAGAVVTITAAKIISQGTAAGIDAGNTCVISILKGTDSIASVTYDNASPFPAENASGSLGALDGTNKIMAAGTKLHLVVTNGATANPPAFMLQVEYTIATA